MILRLSRLIEGHLNAYFPPDDFKLTPQNFKFDCISSDEGPPDAILTPPAPPDRYAAAP